jgi:hypothetical protein
MEADQTIRQLRRAFINHLVALGAELAKKAGMQAFIDVRSELMAASWKSRGSELKGKKLTDYPVIVGPIAKSVGIDLSFPVVTDEKLVSSCPKCSYYDAAKQLGLADIPLCEGICKTTTDTLLKIIAPGFSKKIVKSVWKGDSECRFEITKS